MANPNTFPAVSAALDLRREDFLSNSKAWKAVLEKFEASLQQVTAEGTSKSLLRHQQRGQLLARDRISLLLDPESPFLELGAFAGFGFEDSSPCASLIAGIGSVSGRSCLILSHIPTQSGGAWNELTGEIRKEPPLSPADTVSDQAKSSNGNRNREQSSNHSSGAVGEKKPSLVHPIPKLMLATFLKAGVFLPQQFRVFHKGGQIFRDLAIRSQKGQSSCAVVFGSSTAGGAYHPALSEYTIFVEDQAQVFLGGPPLVKMATGEEIDAEELGGARIHATVTGLADQLAVDEFDALRKAREWVSSLQAQVPRLIGTGAPLPPRYPADDLLSLVNPDIRKPFDMGEVLIRIVDDSRLAVFKPKYGRNMITAWAKIVGHNVAIIANQTPIINPDEASKTTQFIRLCNQQNVPIVFFHNVTGFMVGSKAEHAGIIKRGAQLVSAVSCSTVPHISVILGASYGAGNYAMCGRAYKPRFLFTWPTGRCSVMGPDQLSGVMETVQANSARSKGVTLRPEEVKASVQSFRDSVQRDSESYRTSAALLDDGIIDPRDTRDVLGMCLEVVRIPGVQGTESHRILARM